MRAKPTGSAATARAPSSRHTSHWYQKARACSNSGTGGGAGEAPRSAGEVAGVTTDQGGRDALGDQGSSGEVPATRAARRKAEQLGVELSRLQGSGSEGLITIRDVQAASRQG